MITVTSLREEVKQYLQDQMLNGKLTHKQKISLPKLSNELGVSITPVREALTQLEHAKIVEIIPNRGFFLPHITGSEAVDIYTIIARLESLAVANSKYSKSDISLLKEVQTKIDNSKDSNEILKLDLKFHDLLIYNYDNDTLKSILHDLKIRIFLYECSYMRESELTTKSSMDHQKIIELLTKRDYEGAAQLVERNWSLSINFVMNRL